MQKKTESFLRVVVFPVPNEFESTIKEERPITICMKPNAPTASRIGLAMYVANGINVIRQTMTATDSACRSTPEHEETQFFIVGIVLELTQSIQHSGTQPVHDSARRKPEQLFGQPNILEKVLRGPLEPPPSPVPPGYRTP